MEMGHGCGVVNATFCDTGSMAKDLRKQICNRIRELRAKQDITQQELAEKAGLDYKSIQRLEAKTPRFYPKIHTIAKVAEAFKVSLSDFFKNIR